MSLWFSFSNVTEQSDFETGPLQQFSLRCKCSIDSKTCHRKLMLLTCVTSI